MQSVESINYMFHLKVNGLLPSVQSAYRKCHSTETAMARVLSDILMALDRVDVAALTLLDLSAAFDTFDHHILQRRLRESYSISGVALTWISSYLADRQQSVCHTMILERSQRRSASSLVCRRAPSSGPCYLFCTPPISCR